MIEYPKIDNLYKRNPDKLSELLVGTYTRPEFGLIDAWDVTEKIHGTNVQLRFRNVFTRNFDINGRTDRAQFTVTQEEFLLELGDGIHTDVSRILNSFDLDTLTIYGELYGPKIQSGGNYSESLGFRAFDMLVNDQVWLAPDDVRKNADLMNLEMAPYLGEMTTEQIFLLVAGGFKSTFAKNREYDAEGVIAKPRFNLYDQRNRRVMFKLKHNDLKHLN
jgi:hypothetical protein